MHVHGDISDSLGIDDLMRTFIITNLWEWAHLEFCHREISIFADLSLAVFDTCGVLWL